MNSGVKLKKIKKTNGTLGPKLMNPRPRTRMQKASRSGVEIEVCQGLKCTKLKV
jgi:predicted peroxiredoxin